MQRLLGVIGDPVAHSLSPLLHGELIRRADLPFVYCAFRVAAADLPAAIAGARALGFRGLNVTVPHKQAVLALIDDLSEEARGIGAVNTILFDDDGLIRGENTDCDGFLDGLAEQGGVLKDRRVLVLGAGGAARAVVYAARKAGAARIFIHNRTPERAQDLADAFGAEVLDELRDLPAHDVVINTTSLGMHPHVQACPLPRELFRKEVFYADLVYNPLQTTFLRHAREAGAATADGLGMLIHQGIAAMRLWSDRELDAGLSGDLRQVLEKNLERS